MAKLDLIPVSMHPRLSNRAYMQLRHVGHICRTMQQMGLAFVPRSRSRSG